MNTLNKSLLCTAADVGAFLFLLLVFMFFFLAPFQKVLLESYGTVAIEQTSEATYASIGPTSMVSFLLFLVICIAVLVYFLVDTAKLYFVQKKPSFKKTISFNGLAWFAFGIAFIFFGLLLQELYFFFVLVSFLKPLFLILVSFVFFTLVFFILLVGKKRFFMQKTDWNMLALQWFLLALLVGLMLLTGNSLIISIALLLGVFVYNHTLVVATH